MSALEATMLLPLQRLLPIPLPLFLLLLLQSPLPCHSLLQMLPLLKWLCLPPLPCQRPLRRHPRRARAPGGRPPPHMHLLRYCPPCGPSPRIIPFLVLFPAVLPSAALPFAATPPTAAVVCRAAIRRTVVQPPCRHPPRCYPLPCATGRDAARRDAS